MAETPTFGRYAEIPYDQMTPEQQEGYRSLMESARPAARPEQDLRAQPQAGEGDGAARRLFPHRLFAERARARDRRRASSTASFTRPTRPTRTSAPARRPGCRPTRSRRCSRACRPRSTTSASRSSTRWRPASPTRAGSSKGLYDRAVEALGHDGITDVISLMGFYTSVSMTLAFYDVPAGAEGMAR